MCQQQAQTSPAKTVSLTKWRSKISSVADHKNCHWQAKQRPSALQTEPQTFIRGHCSCEHAAFNEIDWYETERYAKRFACFWFEQHFVSGKAWVEAGYILDNYGVVTFDHLHFSIGIVIGVVSDCMLATLGTTNQKIGVFSDKKDRAVETEGISQSVRVLALLEFSQEKSSSTSSDSSTARMTGHTFLMPQGSVYWESFHLAWSVDMTNHLRSLKIVCRSPLNGSRSSGVRFLHLERRCEIE